jgi:hypothetical protein
MGVSGRIGSLSGLSANRAWIRTQNRTRIYTRVEGPKVWLLRTGVSVGYSKLKTLSKFPVDTFKIPISEKRYTCL